MKNQMAYSRGHDLPIGRYLNVKVAIVSKAALRGKRRPESFLGLLVALLGSEYLKK